MRHDSINKLCRYYFMIRQHAPNARFNLINSNLGAARDMPVELSPVPQPAGPAASAPGIFALAPEDTVRRNGEKYSVLVAPGSGTLVFVGTASEAEQLRRLVK